MNEIKKVKVLTYKDFDTQSEMENFQIENQDIESINMVTFKEEKVIERTDYVKITPTQFLGERKIINVVRLIYKKYV